MVVNCFVFKSMSEKVLINSLRRFFIAFVVLFTMVSGKTSAQTLVWLETFGDRTTPTCDQANLANGFATSNGAWTVTNFGVNDSAANEWYISSTEPGKSVGSCSSPGCFINNAITNRTLHVGNAPNSPNASLICANGDCGAIYDPGGFQIAVQTSKRAESPSFSLPSSGINVLYINYIEAPDTPDVADKVILYFFDGTAWSAPLPSPPRPVACGTGSAQWRSYSVTLPAIASTANVKIGFLWENNNGGAGSIPSFAVDTIVVYNILIPVADITVSDTDGLCVNQCVDFSTLDAGPGATYSWVFNGAATPTSSIRNPTGICYNAPGTFTALLTVTNSSGSSTDSVTMVVSPCAPPVADFYASDSVFCERSCITFTDASTNGATGWNWLFPGGNPSSSLSPAPPPICYDVPGNYDVTLIVFNSFGSDTLVKPAYLTVQTCPLPIADFNSATVQSCPQFCASFVDNSLNGPITSYQWYFPGANPDTSSSANPSTCYSQEGLYDAQLIVTNQYGSDTVYKYSVVDVQFLPGAFASPDTTIEYGQSYQLNATGGTSYSWAPSTGLDSTNIANPVATPILTTTYTVTIDDGSGCTTSRQVTINVLHKNKVFVPNSFSPNGDGRNDYLFVRGNNLFGVRMLIFDRWGEKVFESTNQAVGWDGNYKGEELHPGVYTWVVTVSYENNDSVTETGTVTLVR
jgi:gliding motility-associated-like protein